MSLLPLARSFCSFVLFASASSKRGPREFVSLGLYVAGHAVRMSLYYEHHEEEGFRDIWEYFSSEAGSKVMKVISRAPIFIADVVFLWVVYYVKARVSNELNYIERGR